MSSQGTHTKELAISIIFASLYVALIVVFQSVSFLGLQVRVANCLLALIPLFAMPSVYGITLGVFVGNLLSPFGVFDLLSIIPTFIGAVLILKIKSNILGLLIYNLIIGTWLTVVFGIPLGVPTILLYVGLSVANIGIGYPLYSGLKRWKGINGC